MSKTFVGIDLHSNNSYFAAVDESGKRLFHKLFSNEKADILKVMNRIEEFGDISEIAIEFTYNWYWLDDFLEDQKYKVSPANPAAMTP